MTVEILTAQQTEKSRWPFPRPDLTKEFVDEALKLFDEHKEFLVNNIKKESDRIQIGQARARDLSNLRSAINSAKQPDDTLKVVPDSDLHKLLIKASTEVPSSKLPPLPGAKPDINLSAVNLDPNKTDYTKEEAERLMENIKLTFDDLTTINDMILQKLTRLNTQQTELYQMIKNYVKTLHDTIIAMARAIKGQ